VKSIVFFLLTVVSISSAADGELLLKTSMLPVLYGSKHSMPLAIAFEYQNPNNDSLMYYRYGIDMQVVPSYGSGPALALTAYFGLSPMVRIQDNIFALWGGAIGFGMVDGTQTDENTPDAAFLHVDARINSRLKFVPISFDKWYAVAFSAGLEFRKKFAVDGYPLLEFIPALEINPDIAVHF